MPVFALVASVRTHPKPAVLLVLDCLNKELAHLVCCRLWVPVLAHNDLCKFFLVPVVHAIFLLRGSLLRLLLISGVRVQTSLLRLALDSQVMTKLALPALVAMPLLVELTEYGFRVDAKGHLLDLDGLEEVGGFFGQLLCCCLFLFSLQLFRCLFLFRG